MKRIHPAKAHLIFSALTGLALLSISAAEAPVLSPAQPEAIQRWQDKRFAMFIHWGPVSLTGQEISWSRGAQIPIEVYDKLYLRFNPTNFNAEEWVSVAKAAGMKYIILTTKHHDGFCLWDTKYTEFNIMHSPFGRDVVKELSAACKKQGIAFGTYYSTCDWHHPDFPLGSPGGTTKKPNPNMDRYTEYLRGQVTELIRNYGPLIELWFDVPQETGPERGIPTANLVRSLQPDILINNRVGGTPADFSTPEQQIGAFNMKRPWETCMTICTQWSWKPNDQLKSLQQCLQTLILTAGGNGNLLFNVGPMPDGRIEPRQVERLKEMGAWLQQHGESIYSTRGGPWKPTRSVASTRRGDLIYVHILRWDEPNVSLGNIPAKIIASSLLTGGEPVVKQTQDQVVIS
ncbi:MAG: alpha-L-fucosidase, partial [Limisphaerales bacterium]